VGVVHLYAIRLDDAVMKKKRFIDRNPDYATGKPCYYIGSSIYEPEARFEKHKAGERSSRWVRDYGLHVAKRKCRQIDVKSKSERDSAERAYAAELRAKGYGIWQN